MSDTVFDTERLIVRRPRLEDAEAMYEIYSDPDVNRYLGNARGPESLAQQREALTKIIDRYTDPRFGYWPLVPKESSTMVGAVLLKNLPNSENIEVGWHLGKRSWGKGYASEAGKGAVRHGFEVAGLNEIFAVVFPENVRSIAVTQKLGMVPIGRTSDYYEVELELFRLTRADWQASL